MAHRPDRVCVPLEMEMLPLYREAPGTARLRREQKRQQRREKRDLASRAKRVLARLVSETSPGARRRRV
jgi:hypothetical protein